MDKLFSLYDIMSVMIENDTDECYVWNSDQFNYDGVVSYTDFVEMIMFVYESIQIEKSRTLYFATSEGKLIQKSRAKIGQRRSFSEQKSASKTVASFMAYVTIQTQGQV